MANYVFGLNKSGLSVAKLLKKNGDTFYCWYDNKKIRSLLIKKFTDLKFKKISKNSLINYQNIYVTPGISFFDKRFNNVPLSKFKRDLNLYYQNIKREKIIAITGTNGKSTTTKLIGNILKKKYKNTFVGGNIGDALCNAFTRNFEYSFHVIELSSFQLEKIKNFEPKISILLNLSKDHLDRYKGIREYISAKKNILSKKGRNLNLISLDDKYSKKIFENKKIINKISFSTNKVNADVYYKDGYIIDKYFHENKRTKLKKVSLDLDSKINIQNILASYIVCKYLKIPINFFNQAIKDFRGLPYRSSIIYDNHSKLIINNSKATNISASLASLEGKENIYLILGGIAKENGFEQFYKYRKKIKKIYIYGQSKILINKQIKLNKITAKLNNLEEVINNLWKDLSEINYKASIIFAPACASFDQFENFEKRGEYFNKLIIKKIKNEY